MVHRRNQHDPVPAPAIAAPLHSTVVQAGLSDEQFAEIKRLLQPGYELASYYLAQLHAQPDPSASLPEVGEQTAPAEIKASDEGSHA